MADLITYTDKEQGQSNAAPVVQQFQFGDANEIKTVVNANAALFDALLEQAMTTTLVEGAISIGSYTFPTTVGRKFLLTITANTTFTMPTLANSTNIVFSANVTGDFTITLADTTALGDDYDGTITNRIVFECTKTGLGVQTNIASIENIA